MHLFDDDQITAGDSQHYADFATESLLIMLQPKIEKVVGKKLLPTYAFWRCYTKYADLKKHTDRPSCEISVTVNIKGDGTPWPIFMNGDALNLDKGDAAIYLGCEVDHWREEFKGDYQFQTFLHYVDKEGKNIEHFMDKRKFWGIEE